MAKQMIKDTTKLWRVVSSWTYIDHWGHENPGKTIFGPYFRKQDLLDWNDEKYDFATAESQGHIKDRTHEVQELRAILKEVAPGSFQIVAEWVKVNVRDL